MCIEAFWEGVLTVIGVEVAMVALIWWIRLLDQ